MKAKVVIENGITSIELTPENKFEIDVIENARKFKEGYILETSVDAKYNYNNYTDHKLNIKIKQIS